MGQALSGAIIAAGRGERLRAAIGGIPKPLAIVAGESLLKRRMREMISAGMRPVHAIVNSETARLMRERGFEMPAEADLMVRDTANSMESLIALGARIAPGRFVLATVDAVLGGGRFGDFVTRAARLTDPGENRFDGALGVVRWRGDKHPLFAEVAEGLIVNLGEEPADLVTAGVYLFATGIFDYAAEARRLGLGALRRFLGLLIERGMRFAAVEIDAAIDVDEGVDLDAAGAMLERNGGGE